jgi:hypothetical protein
MSSHTCVIDAISYGVVAGGTIDMGPALMAAYAGASGAGLPLYIRPGRYYVSTPISWIGTAAVDIQARNAILSWNGGNGQTVVNYGGSN